MAKARKMTNAKSSNKTISARVDKDSRVSVRQIENGYIVNESGTTGKGRSKQYYDKEWFSKENPVKGSLKLSGKK
jgi:hypothetical protein